MLTDIDTEPRTKLKLFLQSISASILHDAHVKAYKHFLKEQAYHPRKFIILGPGSLNRYPNLKQMLPIDWDRYWHYINKIIPVDVKYFYSKICISDLHPSWSVLTLMFPDLIRDNLYNYNYYDRNKYGLFLTKMIASDSNETINYIDFEYIMCEGVEITDWVAIK
jgi:hypothetical protein